MKKAVKFSDKELDFAIANQKCEQDEFAKKYVETFGQPNPYIRPISLFHQKDKAVKRREEQLKVEVKTKLANAIKQTESKINLKKETERRGDPIPDEGVLLTSLIHAADRIDKQTEQILKQLKETHDLFAVKIEQKPAVKTPEQSADKR